MNWKIISHKTIFFNVFLSITSSSSSSSNAPLPTCLWTILFLLNFNYFVKVLCMPSFSFLIAFYFIDIYINLHEEFKKNSFYKFWYHINIIYGLLTFILKFISKLNLTLKMGENKFLNLLFALISFFILTSLINLYLLSSHIILYL